MSLGEESRKRIVKSLEVWAAKRGDLAYPRHSFSGGEGPDEAWVGRITIQEGLLPEDHIFISFESESDALAFAKEYPVGSVFLDTLLPKYFQIASLDDWINSPFFPIKAGDEDLHLPWKILVDAGISDPQGLNPSETVLSKLGQDRLGELKSAYGENWGAVAEYEYCLQHLPHSSQAYIAAACRFSYFILENDFAAGYLLRDLEVLVRGVEDMALKSIEMRKKAGASGSKKSSLAREARRTALLDAMEKVVKRNPDITGLGEGPLVELAFAQASEANPALWSQGKGQIMEYVGELRRGEAGEPAKARYHAIFERKPPKRSC